MALHSGTLVKCGPQVRVAVQGAIEGDNLAWLRDRVHEPGSGDCPGCGSGRRTGAGGASSRGRGGGRGGGRG